MEIELPMEFTGYLIVFGILVVLVAFTRRQKAKQDEATRWPKDLPTGGGKGRDELR